MNPTALLSSRRHMLAAVVAVMMTGGPARAAEEGSWFGGTKVVGSGKVVSEARQVTSFQAIQLKGSINLVLRQGSKEAIEISADDNILPLIETEVTSRGGVQTLEIGPKKGANYSTRSKTVVTVDVSDLKRLGVSGSGDVTGEGLKTSDLQLKIVGSGDIHLKRLGATALAVQVSGSGDVSVTGKSPKLSVSIAGSGDVVTRDLEADDVTVSIAGSGDARVNARKTLSVSIAGSGDVAYTGDPAVKTSIAGHGNVKKQ